MLKSKTCVAPISPSLMSLKMSKPQSKWAANGQTSSTPEKSVELLLCIGSAEREHSRPLVAGKLVGATIGF